jgi:septal ring-binding cell division protein DamX
MLDSRLGNVHDLVIMFKGLSFMKNQIIVALSLFLAACSSDSYVTDVSMESQQEDYKKPQLIQPLVDDKGGAIGVSEMNVVETDTPVKMVQPAPSVSLKAPSANQVKMAGPRYGYTIQVVAVGSQTKVDQYVARLPNNDQPIWENYKLVNGTKWYTVLYGDYATSAEASRAMNRLPAEFVALKPFVKSIDSIKNSPFPALNKLN